MATPPAFPGDIVGVAASPPWIERFAAETYTEHPYGIGLFSREQAGKMDSCSGAWAAGVVLGWSGGICRQQPV